MLHAVIMAGGSGTRFWPASRNDRPKQLLDLTGESTMIQATVGRFAGLVEPHNILVVTNQQLVNRIRDQLPGVPTESVIGEPCRRDTAPCVGLAAILVSQNDPDAVMVVSPADHVISTTRQFQSAIQHAVELIRRDATRLVTFGIRPTYPAESFGYIERDAHIGDTSGTDAIETFAVKRFREKPTIDVAAEYVASGDFYWNSGIFVWRAATILDQLRQHEPVLFKHLMTIAESLDKSDYQTVLSHEFEALPAKSIDYAVMEKANQVVVIEAPFSWDDLGSWRSLARLRGEDEAGNTIVGQHLGIDTTGTIVRCDEGNLVVTIGLRDCIVVQSGGATLVADKNCEEQVREVVSQLRVKGWEQFL